MHYSNSHPDIELRAKRMLQVAVDRCHVTVAAGAVGEVEAADGVQQLFPPELLLLVVVVAVLA